MKSLKYLGLALAATTILGAAPVFAAEEATDHVVPSDTDKSTTTEVKIIDSEKTVKPGEPIDPNTPKEDQIAKLTFVEAPARYYFETKTEASNLYALTADASKSFEQKNADGTPVVDENGDPVVEKAITGKYQVHSDAKGAWYRVDSKIDAQLTSDEKKVNVTSFKINDTEVEGVNAVMSNTMTGLDYETSAGFRDLEVKKVAINFTPAEGTTVAAGDLYTGKITNTLYNVYTEAE